MTRPFAIDVEGLRKSFGGRTVVRDLSLQVPEGSIYGFLGPNGSGKTTTIRMICGLLTADGGRGTCLGYDIFRERDAIKRAIGYMTQRFSLYADLTLRENLEFVARVYGLADPRGAAQEALVRLGLEARARQLAGELSGGWKQRLALSACILHAPRLLLLDEPTAGVDPRARREFWDELHRLAAEGMTVLVSTHYMDEAERCHELAYLAYGELLAKGTADALVAGAGLTTWVGTGDALDRAARLLRAMPGVEMVASFGASLHVSGSEPALLGASIEAVRAAVPGVDWQPGRPTLEDVFIHLMSRVQDNFG